ncbi:MAG: FAD-dependent oxidoreductase [Janthinobacterium lividum]
MLFDYDVLIVGAGPAGCAAAFDLAHAGRRVLLLDKRSFPRHKACACGLTRKTLKALRYSVAPILERECRDVVLQEAGPAFLSGRRTADKGCEVRVRLRNPFCAMAVRERFDAFCLDQTLAHGQHKPELRKIEGIVALRELPTHIELDLTLLGGTTQTLRAPTLIGADGSNGQTRRLAAGIAAFHSQSSDLSSRSTAQESALPPIPQDASIPEATAATLPAEPDWYARGFALEATVPYAALPTILPGGDARLDLVFDFSPIAGGYGWLFPKGDHINIGVGGFVPQKPGADAVNSPESAATGAPGMQYEAVTRTLLAEYTRKKLGVDLATLQSAHVSGQHLGLGGHAYTPQGRLLLTGDAAGLVDPLTGEGIHSAIVSGQAAASAILEVLPSTAQATTRAAAEAVHLAAAYARHLAPLRETLTFSQRAARSFYREPERGFKVMRTPLLRSLVLKTYADGLPTTKLLTRLARRVA